MFTLTLMLSHVLVFPQQADIYLEVVGKTNAAEPWVFFAPHENEFVVNNYVAEQVTERGGTFYVLRQHGSRHITLTVEQQQIYIDPNRLFTDKGIKASIKKLNPKLAPNDKSFQLAVIQAHYLKTFILKQLKTNKTWLAVHNNTDGYKGDGKGGLGDVSIIRYQTKLDSGAQYLIDVSQQGLTKNVDEDDLYFVTDAADFKKMKSSDWNAVLQNPIVTSDPEEDDGSLSVYAQMHDIRYINIEAERIEHFDKSDKTHGSDHLEVQQQMIDFTLNLFDKTP